MPTLDELKRKVLAAALQGKDYLVDKASNLVPSVSVGSVTSAIDTKKRLLAESLRQIATDPGEFFSQTVAQQKGPSAEAMADPNALLASPGGKLSVGGIPGVMTYHGTPHTVDRYDLSKVGTGQGAQSYGHGIYFAEHPAVAQDYKNTLGRVEVIDPSGKVLFSPGGNWPKDAPPEIRAGNLLEYAHATGAPDPFAYAKGIASGETHRVLSQWEKAGAKPRVVGQLYKQDLPDEVLPKMLQWDKPLSEQPHVMKALDRLGVKLPQGNIDPIMGSDLILRNLLSGLSDANGVVLGKHEALASQGIPGVSYLDQGSRPLRLTPPNRSVHGKWTVGDGQGGPLTKTFDNQAAAEAYMAANQTRNHVVWDQDLLDRMKPVPHE